VVEAGWTGYHFDRGISPMRHVYVPLAAAASLVNVGSMLPPDNPFCARFFVHQYGCVGKTFDRLATRWRKRR
jgi:hypothetical protein